MAKAADNNLKNQLDRLVELVDRRKTIRLQEQDLSEEISRLCRQISESTRNLVAPEIIEKKWKGVVEREIAAKSKIKRIFRLRLYKALKDLGYKNREISAICKISTNGMPELKKDYKKMKRKYGKWLMDCAD